MNAKKLGRHVENSCACSLCIEMCRRAPCAPVPDEVLALVKAGYRDRLVNSIYEFDGGEVGYIGPNMEQHGCTFLLPDGKCELHDKGLKPLEGRLAHHSLPDLGLKARIMKTWLTPIGIQAMAWVAGHEWTPEQTIQWLRKTAAERGIADIFQQD